MAMLRRKVSKEAAPVPEVLHVLFNRRRKVSIDAPPVPVLPHVLFHAPHAFAKFKTT